MPPGRPEDGYAAESDSTPEPLRTDDMAQFQMTPAPMPLSPQGQMLPPVGEAITEEDEEEEEEDHDDYGEAQPVSEHELQPQLPKVPSVRFADQVETADIGQDEPVETSSGAPPRPLSLASIKTPSRERQTASHLTPHPSAERPGLSPSQASSMGPSAAIRGRAAAEAASRSDRGAASRHSAPRHFPEVRSAVAAAADEDEHEDLLRFPLKRDVWRAPNARRAAGALGGPSFGTRRSQATSQEYSERRTTELARVFALLDEDADGLLDVDQMRIFVAAAGFAPTPQFLQRVIDATPRKWAHDGIDFDTVVQALETRAEDEPLSEDDLAHLLRVSCGPTWTAASARQAMKAEGAAERQAVQLLASERQQGAEAGGGSAGGAARSPSAASEAARAKMRNGGLSRCVAHSEHAMRLLSGIETQVQSRLTAAEAETLLQSAGAFSVSAEGSQEPAMDVLDFVSWLSSGYTRQVRSHYPEVSYQFSPTEEEARKRRMEGGGQERGAGGGAPSSPVAFRVGALRSGNKGDQGKGKAAPPSALARLTASSFDADRVAATDPEDFLARAKELEARADKLGM